MDVILNPKYLASHFTLLKIYQVYQLMGIHKIMFLTVKCILKPWVNVLICSVMQPLRAKSSTMGANNMAAR